MSRVGKIAIGLATIWPFVYMFIFFAFVFGMLFALPNQPAPAETGMPAPFIRLFALHIITMLWIMALTAFYIVNVFRNECVGKDQKALWAIVIFFGSVIAMPVYWYLYIWREPTVRAVLPESDTQT